MLTNSHNIELCTTYDSLDPINIVLENRDPQHIITYNNKDTSRVTRKLWKMLVDVKKPTLLLIL